MPIFKQKFGLYLFDVALLHMRSHVRVVAAHGHRDLMAAISTETETDPLLDIDASFTSEQRGLGH